MKELISTVRQFLINNGFIIVAAITAFELLMFLLLLAVHKKRKAGIALIMAFMALGLVLDGVAMLSGTLLKQGDILYWINKGRYFLHGIMVPLMFTISLYALDPLKGGKILAWIITFILMGAGVAMAYFTEIEPVEFAGIIRYTQSDLTPKWAQIVDRVMTIGGVVPVILAGIFLLKKEGNISMLLAAIMMFVFSALGPITKNMDLNFMISMFGEALMMLFFLITALTIEVERD